MKIFHRLPQFFLWIFHHILQFFTEFQILPDPVVNTLFPVLNCKILPEEIPEYTVGVIGSWSGERKYLSREEVEQLLSASDPKTRILAEMLRYFEGKTWIVSCADCQEAFGILVDAEMREAFGLDEQEQIGPKLEM